MEIQGFDEIRAFEPSYENTTAEWSADEASIKKINRIYLDTSKRQAIEELTILCGGRAGVEIEVGPDGKASGRGYVDITWA